MQTIFTFFTPLELALILALIALLLFYLYRKYMASRPEVFFGDKKLPAIRKSFENYRDAILLLSEKERVLFSNKACADMLNLQEGFGEEALGRANMLKVPGRGNIKILDLLKSYRHQEGKPKELTLNVDIVQEGSEVPAKLFLGRIEKPLPCYIVSIADISREMDVTALRQRDHLTKLPNQVRAINDLGMTISKMHSQRKSFALILLSLDNFTEIRAMLGYQQTDNLINRIARELKHFSKGMDSELYHMMRNNFLLVVPEIDRGAEAKEVVGKIKKRLKASFDYSGSRMPLTFSTGISFFPQSGSSVDALIDSAYKALSEAKEYGNGYIMVDEDGHFSKDKLNEIKLYEEIQLALKNGEFEIYYQPLVSIENELITGAEALIRWNHPKKGMISPAAFIPLAEKTGFIAEIGRFVIEKAIKQQKRWEIFKFRKIQVSINLSLREIESAKVVEFIGQTLVRHQVAPNLVKFEITENSAMVNPETTKSEFQELKNLGVHLALDDFGTGYSSFSYLKDFSLDTLKIDLSFVRDMKYNSEHRKIVYAMIDLGHNFGLSVTAEGIEDEETYKLLKSYGCDTAQGYYFSKPLPVFEFQELIRRQTDEKTNRGD